VEKRDSKKKIIDQETRKMKVHKTPNHTKAGDPKLAKKTWGRHRKKQRQNIA